ncbi:hypothetical protein [Ramlibacter humi]|uniref:Uncharacterized protein n=1 Tax=Ramlibacter humi TaxID=2530451 RepID=A0A4Z0CC23_9BURK|nr:hypothetical protein [Ramlibacter humi]TFZ07619.1 hypothetical protein EZ216_00170 [Ramlibacter humi]
MTPQAVPVPVPGQRYVDPAGLHWKVQAVHPLRGGETPYYAVSLRFGPEPIITLSCFEFQRLHEQRELRDPSVVIARRGRR